MLYPERLVPQPFFKFIDFNQANTHLSYLVRFTDTRNILDDLGYLREELISTHESHNHLRDFSTYLLGIFTPDDIQWVWKKDTPCLQEWAIGEEGLVPASDEVSKAAVERGCFYLSVFECNGASFSTKNEQEGESEFVCKVLHTPLRANFWHCSLRWYCNEQGSEEWNKGRMRRMKNYIRDFIVENALIKKPLYQSIDPISYTVIPD